MPLSEQNIYNDGEDNRRGGLRGEVGDGKFRLGHANLDTMVRHPNGSGHKA